LFFSQIYSVKNYWDNTCAADIMRAFEGQGELPPMSVL